MQWLSNCATEASFALDTLTTSPASVKSNRFGKTYVMFGEVNIFQSLRLLFYSLKCCLCSRRVVGCKT